MYINSKTDPSLQVIFSLERKYQRKRLVINENRTRLENAAMSTVNGDDTNETPKMHVMFMKQLPTMFPKAKFKCPFFVALMLVASSGRLVPRAMTVAPMITRDMPM
jgi:hypothetical protein